MYVVGDPGTSVSWNGVKRYAVETVWLQAMVAECPMLMSGTPSRLPPVTSSLPGSNRCEFLMRSAPLHEKFGLPSSRPPPVVVPYDPTEIAMLPMVRVTSFYLSPSDDSSGSSIGIGAD